MRIVGLGDSFTVFRDGQGRNYLRYAESLARRAGFPARVVNLAQSGFGIADYFDVFESYGAALGADVAVFGLYLGNDIFPSDGPTLRVRYREERLRSTPTKAMEAGQWSLRRLAKQSVLANYVYRRLKAYVPALHSGFFDEIVARLQREIGRDDIYVAQRLRRADPRLVDMARADIINGWDLAGAIFFPRRYLDLYEQTPGSPAVEATDGFLDDLDYLIAFCRQREIVPVMVLLHPGFVVAQRYRTYFERLDYLLPRLDTKPYAIEVRLHRFLDERAVIHLDSLAVLREANGEIYIPNDIHLNSVGQEAVGRALFRRLESQGLIGRRDG